MNPLTQVANTQRATRGEVAAGTSDAGSWHARFRHSAYVFAGGLPTELTEGDVLAVFSQCGEVVDLHLVRDKATGRPRGFAFLAYADQRSTVLAVDNLSGAKVASRTIRVEHVDSYRRKRAEVEGEAAPSGSEEDEGAAAAAARGVEGRAGRGGGAGGRGGGGGGGGGGGAEPWAAAGSVFSMLAEARAAAAAAKPGGGGAAGAPPKAKRERKEGTSGRKEAKRARKEARRERRRSRSRSGGRRRRSRSRSRERRRG
jgi:RNA-binding motif X-linked protein 2